MDADKYDATKDDGAGYTFTYDAFGRIKEVWDAYGQLCEGSEYDSAGRLKKSYDSVGLILDNEYDLGGRTTDIYTTERAESAAPVQTYTTTVWETLLVSLMGNRTTPTSSWMHGAEL